MRSEGGAVAEEGRLERALWERLGWHVLGLDPKYRRRSTPTPPRSPTAARAKASKLKAAAKTRGVGRSLRQGRRGPGKGLAKGVGRGTGGGSPMGMHPMCTLTGEMAARASQRNGWDLALVEDARVLEAADSRFFSRHDVATELGLSTSRSLSPAAAQTSLAAAPASAAAELAASAGLRAPSQARVSACGLLRDQLQVMLPPSTGSRVSATQGATRETGGGPWTLDPGPTAREAGAPLSRSPLGPSPVCIHRRFRNACCWAVGQEEHDSPQPRLPAPIACTLPPAGQLSPVRSVRVPAVPNKHSHASCALACAPHAHAGGLGVYGLEEAGRFCMCLSAADAATATPLSGSECQPACSSAARLHMTLPGQSMPLPCGGSEAVALFSVDEALLAMGAAAAARGLHAAANERPREMCAPMSEPCFSLLAQASAACTSPPCQEERVRELYVQAVARGGHDGGAASTSFVPARILLGCFDETDLTHHGLTHKPMPPRHRAAKDAADQATHDSVVSCSRGCARYAYFAFGSDRLVGGSCVCGDMPLVTWNRDAEGLDGLKQKTIRSRT